MFDFSLLNNPILNVDSYKSSHYLMYPNDASVIYSYIESRGGDGDATVFVGPQMFIKRYLMERITHDHVDDAKEILTNHGLPFNEDGWRRIVNQHAGRLPLRIKAVKEGSVVPKLNVLSTIENTDPSLAWLTSYIETAYIRACWYPTNVATLSYEAKKILRTYLEKSSDLTGDDLEAKLSFMLHDFGARGVSSKESAEIGGVGHLLNFMGTDTVGALLQARVFYHEPMAGFSISASEHSTVTSWGRAHELDFYCHQLQTFGKPGNMFASVIDSYDADVAIRDMWGTSLKPDLIASGSKVILRPDSGIPSVVVPRLLNMAGSAFGISLNSKGYKLLPPYVGMIQGDGITLQSLPGICEAILAAGWSLENMAFGMGGGLLQQHNRDTHKFAMKTSAIFRDGGWHDVYKAPKDDPGKGSKRGRLGLYKDSNGYRTGPIGEADDRLEIVYENGRLLRDQTFADMRNLTRA
jgi:nicotinamide phosphoribosyltransferase